MNTELQIILNGEPDSKAELRLSFPSASHEGVSQQLVDGRVHVAQGPLTLDYGFFCFGYDIHEFSRALTKLHGSLRGTASFVNQEGNVEISITPSQRTGRLEVQLRLQYFSGSPSASPDPTWLSLSGFSLDQSYLPGMASRILEFVRETGVQVGHPMAGTES